jgi:hypothetical protein
MGANREVAMTSDESDFEGIDTEHILAMLHELEQAIIQSAHSSTTLEPDANLRERIVEIRTEIERRTDEGDPVLLDMAAKRLVSDAAPLPPTEPEWASTLTAQAVPSLTDGELRNAFKGVESDIELHRKAYGEVSEIEAAGKINMRRTAIVNWRKNAEGVLESLVAEMLSRGLQTSAVAPKARSDRPERRREGPVTAARRAIVRGVANLSDLKICRRLDLDRIPLPEAWEGVTTWVQAIGSENYRQNVPQILTKDRHAGS